MLAVAETAARLLRPPRLPGPPLPLALLVQLLPRRLLRLVGPPPLRAL